MTITFSIKRGSFWQGGKQRHANHEDKELRTVTLSAKERDAIDPHHTDLQSAEEAAHEAKKLKLEADLAEKKSAALAKLDAEHAAELEKGKEKPAEKKGGGK